MNLKYTRKFSLQKEPIRKFMLSIIDVMRYRIYTFILLVVIFSPIASLLKAGKIYSVQRQYYELRIYHLADRQQEAVMDNFLQNAFLRKFQNNH